MFETVLPVRVYYEDTDAGGIVYHASYLRFMERGRTESLRSLGVNLTDLLNKYNIQFVLKKMQIDYKKVGKLDDVLQVVSNIVEVRKASLVYNQKIYLEGEDKRLLCEADAVIACIDLSGKPSSLPDFIKREILK